jgi:hypothetical protein
MSAPKSGYENNANEIHVHTKRCLSVHVLTSTYCKVLRKAQDKELPSTPPRLGGRCRKTQGYIECR